MRETETEVGPVCARVCVCVYVCVCVRVRACVCACVCVCVRDREMETERLVVILADRWGFPFEKKGAAWLNIRLITMLRQKYHTQGEKKKKKKSRLMNTFREEWLVSTGGVPTKIGRGKVGVRGLVTGNE